MNTASTISQRDAYKLMLKDYPDVMSMQTSEQLCSRSQSAKRFKSELNVLNRFF